MKKWYLLICILILMASNLLAQEWVQTNGPGAMGYNNIIAIVFNKQKDIFVLSSGDGDLRTNQLLIRSTDKGLSWTTLNHGGHNHVGSIAIAPNNDIYLAHSYNDSGISRSTDNGNTWIDIPGMQTVRVQKILASPDSSLYTLGFNFDDTNYSVYRSTDEGKTWISLDLFISFQDYGELSVDSSGNLFRSSTSGLFKSIDKGANWTKISDFLFGYITIGKKSDIYINRSDSIIQSSDDGKTWFPFSQKNGVLVSSPSGRIFFGREDSLKYSDDNGKSWNIFGTTGSEWFGISFMSTDPDGGIYLQAGGILFYGNHSGSLSPARIPLSCISAIVITPNNQLIAATNPIEGAKNLLHSSDTGISWLPILDTANPEAKWFVIDSNKDIIGGYGNLTRSTNSGKSWKRVMDYGYLWYCGVVHQNGYVFCGTTNNGLFQSTNNGESWRKVDSLKERYVVSIFIDSMGILYAGCDTRTYRSYDSGNSWSLIFIDTNFVVMNMACDLYGDIFVANGYGGRIYRSYDNGKTWSLFMKGLGSNYFIHALVSAPDGTVFALTDSGVFKHSLGNCFWIPFSEGLSTKDVLSLAIDKEGKLYAGSNGGGVFRSIQKFNSLNRFIPRLLPVNISFDTVSTNSINCKDIFIRNAGNSPFTLKSFTVVDPYPFSVADESAKKLPIVVNPKDSIVMSICFHPPQNATYSSLIIWNTDIDDSICPGTPNESILSGVAIPEASVKPTENNFYFSLQPNPVSGSMLKVSFSKGQDHSIPLSIYDLLGREMTHNDIAADVQDFEVSIKDLPEGIYYARIVSDGKTYSEQFVKVSN
jgi:photosystem II stability/assembly factor-like uncharacterized protein